MDKTKFAISLVLLAALCFAQQETGKVAVVHYKFNGTSLEETGAEIVYGLPPDYASTGGAFGAALTGGSGTQQAISFNDPRISYGDQIGDNGLTFDGGFDPNAEFTLIMPVDSRTQSLTITNASSGEKVTQTNLAPLFKSFCSTHSEDSDCKPKTSSGGQQQNASQTDTQAQQQTPIALPQTDYIPYLIIAGAIVLVGAGYMLFARKKN
jgi:hypothetical protein